MSGIHLDTVQPRSRSRSPAAPSTSNVHSTSTSTSKSTPAGTDTMASATGIPDGPHPNDHDHHDPDPSAQDYEPLLGAPGDQVQEKSKPLPYNLLTGTAILAQAGILVLAATVWAAVATHDFIWPFSGHPVLNSVGALCGVEAALILQPTHTPAQKRGGAIVHGSLNGIAFVAYLAAFVMIYYNKSAHGGVHFESTHAILGLTTYLVLLVQSAVGFTMYAVPSLYGSVDRAKSVWKYHRMSGYAVLTLGLATVCAATTTDYNKNVLGMQLWVMVVASVLILLGLLPRVKLQKFGLKTNNPRL